MGTNDELGITHPGNGDGADLGAIVDLVIEQIKPMLVPQFASKAARAVAYPDGDDGPPLAIIANALHLWSTFDQELRPVTGFPFINSKDTTDTVGAGAAGQVSVDFEGPAGFYLVFGSMSIVNDDPTKPIQLVSREVRFNGQSGGTTPFHIMLGQITAVTHVGAFIANDTGSQSAQMICTPQTYPARIFAGSNVIAHYLGGGNG